MGTILLVVASLLAFPTFALVALLAYSMRLDRREDREQS